MTRWWTLVGIAFGPWIIALTYVLLNGGSTAAYNSYVDEYRKWPWRAGVEHLITTCPDDPPHQGQTWAKDIDVGGSFPVHSTSSRGIVTFNAWDQNPNGHGGNMLVIQEQDGLQYWVHYLHLAQPAFPAVGTWVYQGQYVGISGATGGPYGAHLHFGMSPCQYYGCDSISIYPIGGLADDSDCVSEESWYPSDNAGVGDVCGPPCDDTTPLDSTYYQSFTQAFQSYGAYDGIGVTWDPCGGGTCWWVHPWDSQVNPSYQGVVQDFESPNPAFRDSAIMEGDTMAAHWVFGDFWEKYTSSCAGPQYFDYLGYPATEQFEYDYEQHHFWRQNFQGGYIFKSDADNVLYVRDYSGEPFAASCGDTDSDEDGCMDAEEVPPGTGPMTPGANGGFDPYDHWDFFDVPVPSNADPTPNGTWSGAITMSDVLAILNYIGAHDNGPPNTAGFDYDSDKGVDIDGDTIADIPPDGIEDGLDYDRSPSSPPDPPWDAGPPVAPSTWRTCLRCWRRSG
jgi:murein DD-endopeptidase MepM/ murein hydrolase activator NlpD